MTDHTDVLKKIKQIDEESLNEAMRGLVFGDPTAVTLAYAYALDQIRIVVNEALESTQEADEPQPESEDTAEESGPEDLFEAMGIDSVLPLLQKLGGSLRGDTSIREDADQKKAPSDPIADILSALLGGRS